jgi:hypothetical protein
VSGKFDALGDECRELLRLGLGGVKMIGDAGLPAGDADREPASACAEGRDGSTRAAAEMLFVSFAMPAM